MPIVVAGQRSHTTEASDGILAEPAVIGPRLSGEELPQRSRPDEVTWTRLSNKYELECLVRKAGSG